MVGLKPAAKARRGYAAVSLTVSAACSRIPTPAEKPWIVFSYLLSSTGTP